MTNKPITKYGMPASESERIVVHHFVVMGERKLLREVRLAHAIRSGPALSAALQRVGKE